jgi:hypothetical protein
MLEMPVSIFSLFDVGLSENEKNKNKKPGRRYPMAFFELLDPALPESVK